MKELFIGKELKDTLCNHTFFSLGFTHYTYRLIKRFFNINKVAPYNDLWRSVAESKDFLIFL